ncbi:PepSY-associated TM helix domain-containing protein [Pseudoalteromonas luteoviolacea]|uniref:PepSY-associated TM helix domain-containing protein n=1 Tax=Pseudoalteromonas luteoviolacea TaxID=43657 RepID=UPI001B35DD9F|nr:PepSY-associated TM helix domain-containing protein [Pseudoalteromonas luteoviolacea]MBQ4838078.1 PepSY domain-containing protein [Pseudoalteromonas luteoviolacea]
MKDSFFRSMTWLHTWVGLLMCWLLFLIFFAGTISFFRHEISLWNQPAVHNIENNKVQQSALIDAGLEYLGKTAPDANRWWIGLPSPRQPEVQVSHRHSQPDGQRDKWIDERLDPNTLNQVDGLVDTRGGNFFYRLHFDLHYMDRKLARWLVCLASLFMLIALISGIVIHKRIFKDMFQFRPQKGVRAWLDAHNLSSVLALPFHLMITYTGLVTLIFMLFPDPANTLYEDGVKGFRADFYPERQRTEATEQQLSTPAFDSAFAHFHLNWPEQKIKRVIVDHPSNMSATIKIYGDNGTLIRDEHPYWQYSGTTGELLKTARLDPSSGEVLYGGMIAVHSGRLAHPGLRWLYFICGIAGCIMIASGCIMWAKRIRERLKPEQSPSFGLKLVEALNLGTIMGLPLATAGFFYANRLLPSGISDRAEKEILVFFIVWLASAIVAGIRRNKLAWQGFAYLNAVTWLLLPICNALTTDGNLMTYIVEDKWILASFDLAFLATAAAFALQGKKLSSKSSKASAVKVKPVQKHTLNREQKA